jgi:hypothetical protein
VRVGYTDNAFYSETNRAVDVVINPEVRLGAFMRVSELNTLKVAVGVGYEYYVNNHVLNADAPLVNPNTELTFNLFAGDFHFRMHERFSFQQTLFINTTPSGQDLLFNFNDTGIFSRWDNFAGVDVDWDLGKAILTFGYDHETFQSTTESFTYLDRSSDWLSASVAIPVGDQAQVGVEVKGGLHNYDTETTLNDHNQVRGGPFVDFKLPAKISFRAGGGYDRARYDEVAPPGSSYTTYYAYGRISQETRFFTHALSAGRETLLGENANNLEDLYVRYAISSPIFTNTDLSLSGAVHWDKEYGGAFHEEFTYYVVGARVGYQIHKYWRAELGYEFLLKDSDLPDRNYYRNRVTLGLNFTF